MSVMTVLPLHSVLSEVDPLALVVISVTAYAADGHAVEAMGGSLNELGSRHHDVCGSAAGETLGMDRIAGRTCSGFAAYPRRSTFKSGGIPRVRFGQLLRGTARIVLFHSKRLRQRRRVRSAKTG